MKKLASLIALLAATVSAFAQSGGSVISGSVKDPAGAAIAGANVLVTNTDTGFTATTGSNEEGLYRIGSLVPGAYRVEIQAAGFQKVTRAIAIQVGQVAALDIALEVAGAHDTVVVTEAAPLTDSQTSSIGQVVNPTMLQGLPLPNRAASSLAALAPGVVMIDNGAGTAENYPVFSVAGGRARNQNFTLDGGNVSNAVGLTRPQQLTSLPVDAMQEFKIVANTYGRIRPTPSRPERCGPISFGTPH
jgi:hypothetical protein